MSTFQINPKFIKDIPSQKIIKAIGIVKQSLNIGDCVFSVVIEDESFIHELNKKYRKIDAPTDVLAFTANEIDPESNSKYLGDIIIAFPIAKKQAKEYNHEILEELMLLIIHGLLHLLGYNHKSKKEKLRMFSLQEKILNNLKTAI